MNKNANRGTHLMTAFGLALFSMGLLLRVVPHPAAGAESGFHFVAGLMLGVGIVLTVFGFFRLRGK